MKKFMVIIAVIAMVGAFAATSMAAEWSFYGSARLNTTYYDKSQELTPEGLYDDQDMTWAIQSNTRIGAKVKASDAVSGRFEFAVANNNGKNTDSTKTDLQGIALRLMYGEYHFGSGSLLVGQDYTPVDQILSSSIGALAYQIKGNDPVFDGEGDSLTIGSFYESRKPQIKLKFGNLQLAFIQMATSTLGNYTDKDTTIPKVEVSYAFKTDAFSITPYGGYNTVEAADPLTDNSITIDSYVFGAAGKVNFGPMWVAANLFWAQNAQNYGRLNAGLYDGAELNGSDTEDASTWGGQVIAGFKLSDMLAFEAGYSYDHNEVDLVGADAGRTGENDPTHWYVNATITLAPGVYIIPEIGMFDFGDDDNGARTIDQGDATYYGVEWKINF